MSLSGLGNVSELSKKELDSDLKVSPNVSPQNGLEISQIVSKRQRSDDEGYDYSLQGGVERPQGLSKRQKLDAQSVGYGHYVDLSEVSLVFSTSVGVNKTKNPLKQMVRVYNDKLSKKIKFDMNIEKRIQQLCALRDYKAVLTKYFTAHELRFIDKEFLDELYCKPLLPKASVNHAEENDDSHQLDLKIKSIDNTLTQYHELLIKLTQNLKKFKSVKEVRSIEESRKEYNQKSFLISDDNFNRAMNKFIFDHFPDKIETDAWLNCAEQLSLSYKDLDLPPDIRKSFHAELFKSIESILKRAKELINNVKQSDRGHYIFLKLKINDFLLKLNPNSYLKQDGEFNPVLTLLEDFNISNGNFSLRYFKTRFETVLNDCSLRDDDKIEIEKDLLNLLYSYFKFEYDYLSYESLKPFVKNYMDRIKSYVSKKGHAKHFNSPAKQKMDHSSSRHLCPSINRSISPDSGIDYSLQRIGSPDDMSQSNATGSSLPSFDDKPVKVKLSNVMPIESSSSSALFVGLKNIFDLILVIYNVTAEDYVGKSFDNTYGDLINQYLKDLPDSLSFQLCEQIHIDMYENPDLMDCDISFYLKETISFVLDEQIQDLLKDNIEKSRLDKLFNDFSDYNKKLGLYKFIVNGGDIVTYLDFDEIFGDSGY